MSDPAKGKWKVIEPRFKHLPVHVALLHTGKVLGFGGSGNDENKIARWDPPEIYEPDYTGQTEGKTYEIPGDTIEGDIFCVGQAFLPDGKLFIAGGTYKYDGPFGFFPPFSGLDHAYTFDPKNNTWTRIPNMKHGRWYPTCVMLADGRIATFAGLTKGFPWLMLRHHEIYTEGVGWQKIEGADKWFPLYPRMHLLPNGELFFAGSYNTHMTFPFSLKAFKISRFNFERKKWIDMSLPEDLDRQEGSTVLLPLNPPNYKTKVMLMGGGNTVAEDIINKVEMIDLSEDKPRYKTIASMKHPRYYVYPVILPDQNILVVGGKKGHKGHHPGKHGCKDDKGEIRHDPNAIMEAELFHTDTEQWETLAEMTVDRLYHSNAILLPNGCVMTVGSNPMRRCNELRIEIFSPPYLHHQEDRPAITKNPDSVDYGNIFEIETPDADTIKSIAFIRPSTTTHCLNPEQRYVGLEFEKKSSIILEAKVPTNRNILPPGYYMLFIVNESDIPCIAPFVKVNL